MLLEGEILLFEMNATKYCYYFIEREDEMLLFY
jgi:hypothetical protein